MRRDIVHIGAGELHYEICSIADIARDLEELDRNIYWENIGDPIMKGEKPPQWLKDIVAEALKGDAVYAYSPTKGMLASREYLADASNRQGGTDISPDDIIFFNGLGDAVSKVFGLLKRTARVLVPSPGYMTFAAAEASHAGTHAVPFYLDPTDNWLPDLTDLENRIKHNPSVAAVLLTNPENPTGLVYPTEILETIVGLAKKYDLFVIFDEVYHNIVYNNQTSVALAELIGDVPGIAMKSISKEMPWPGARCGWIEVYNRKKDQYFENYINSILNAKMLEVCSTTLPQTVLPKIVSHPGYKSFITDRVKRYETLANITYEMFCDTKGIIVNRSNGAFYMTIVLQDQRISQQQSLPIESNQIRSHIEKLVATPTISNDTRFCYFLLGATGICAVPLSSFNTELQGFRITLLETDEEIFVKLIKTLKASINQYLASA
jgi:aspartate/methionine/tyrosine aminotransferase